MNEPLPMLDVSSNNHPNNDPINWVAVYKAGYRAVMIKATESYSVNEQYMNPYLRGDALGAHNAGLGVGYYHFARPGAGTAALQCNALWQHVKDLPRSIGLALDMEETDNKTFPQLDTWANDFLNLIPTEVKFKILYTSASWEPHFPITLRTHQLWLASWGVQRPPKKVYAWQESENGKVRGITGPVDIGLYYGPQREAS